MLNMLKIRSDLFITCLFKPYQKDKIKFLHSFSSVFSNALFLDLHITLIF